jgi:hypothetical protein
VRKQFVRGRRETSRLMRTAPIAFGDTSIYANRRRSRSARLLGERKIWDQRVQIWKEIVRGGGYNTGTHLPAPGFAVRSVTNAGTCFIERCLRPAANPETRWTQKIQLINQLCLCSFCRLRNAEILSRRCENIELVSPVPLTADSSVEISLSRALYSGSSLM